MYLWGDNIANDLIAQIDETLKENREINYRIYCLSDEENFLRI
jgi:hypothetical protein